MAGFLSGLMQEEYGWRTRFCDIKEPQEIELDYDEPFDITINMNGQRTTFRGCRITNAATNVNNNSISFNGISLSQPSQLIGEISISSDFVEFGPPKYKYNDIWKS